MKIIHCGDIHLDSKMESLPAAKARIRRNEVTEAFRRMVDFAVENSVSAVIIAGDLFDSDRITKATADLVFGKIRECDGIEFYYLRGNHDACKSFDDGELPKNLHLFSNSWVTYEIGDVAVTGVELNDENCRHIYGSLRLPQNRFNIVTMHGELTAASAVDAVNRSELADKGIDYLALGHIHKHDLGTLGQSGVWCYPGCLEGRGFDECGEKGFVLLDIDGSNFRYKFIKNSSRDIVEVNCDISGIGDTSEMIGAIDRSISKIGRENIVKLCLTGNVPVDAHKDTEYFKGYLADRFWFAKVKDETRLELRPELYENDISLKGEFIRQAKESGLEGEMLDRVIACGLAALRGDEL